MIISLEEVCGLLMRIPPCLAEESRGPAGEGGVLERVRGGDAVRGGRVVMATEFAVSKSPCSVGGAEHGTLLQPHLDPALFSVSRLWKSSL